MNRASIKDVARLAGCSTGTVSLALRHSERIKAATRERVLKAAAQLNYRPNLSASRLSSKRSQIVGIILLPLLQDEGLQMLYGITEQLQARKFRSLIEFTGMSFEREVAAARRLIEEGVDGVLVNSAVIAQEPTHLIELQQHGIPVVLMDLLAPGVDCSYGGIRNESGAFEIVRHPIDVGHRRIACVGRLFTRDTKKSRRAGYFRALTESGLAIDEDLVLDGVCVSLSAYILDGDNTSDWQQRPIEAQVQSALDDTEEKFLKVLTHVLALDDPPTAFFTVDSGALLSLLAGLTKLGVRVPEDVSVVTFEGIPYLPSLGVRVSTVAIPAYQIGYGASRLLIEQIEGVAPDEMRSIQIEPEILYGNSVAPPPGNR